jgi:hypothetical protein
MNRILGAAVKVAGSLVITGGTILAAVPASAAPTITTEAYGATAKGPITLAPVAVATPGHSAVVASSANVAGFLATGVITDRADASIAVSRVNSPVVTMRRILASLRATYVTSSCSIRGLSDIGRADIYNGSIVQVGQRTIPLPSHPAPNTLIVIDGARVTLNYQIEPLLGGPRTVAAVFISQPGLPSGQSLSLGITECNGLINAG